MRGMNHPQTGNAIYTHIIDPVVPNADYTIMNPFSAPIFMKVMQFTVSEKMW